MKLILTLIGVCWLNCALGSTVLSWNLNSISKDLVADVAEPSTDKPLVVFVLPKFDLGAFSKAADVYNPTSSGGKLPTLKKMMTEGSNQNIYRMPDAYNTIETDVLSKVPSEKVQKEGLSLLAKPSAVVVSVEDFDGLEEAVKGIKSNLSAGNNHNAYTAVIVGREEQPHLVAKRAAGDKPDPKKDKLFYAKNNCLFTIDGAVLHTGCMRGSAKENRARVHLKMPPTVEGTCQEKPGAKGVWEPSNITLTFSGVAPKKGEDAGIEVTTLKVSLNFAMNKHLHGYWDGAVVIDELKGKKVPTIDSPRDVMRSDATDMQSVTHFSYSCDKTPVYCVVKKNAKETGAPNVGITFEKLRVEPFGADMTIPKNRPYPVFGEADDCVGFFSIGTLMGLMSGVILLLVFFFGICMISG